MFAWLPWALEGYCSLVLLLHVITQADWLAGCDVNLNANVKA